MAPPAQSDPAAQAKGLRTIAATLVVAGLLVGLGIPVFFLKSGIEAYMTPWGFDAIWLVGLLIMVIDFALARMLWRRAKALGPGYIRARRAIPVCWCRPDA